MKRRWRFDVKFVPGDCWIGVFWKRTGIGWSMPLWQEYDGRVYRTTVTDVYICIIPMLPIHVHCSTQDPKDHHP